MDYDDMFDFITKNAELSPDGKSHIAMNAEQRRRTVSLLWKWYADADSVTMRDFVSDIIKGFNADSVPAEAKAQFANTIFQMLQSAERLSQKNEAKAKAELEYDMKAAQEAHDKEESLKKESKEDKVAAEPVEAKKAE
jgi:hypothetical protein